MLTAPAHDRRPVSAPLQFRPPHCPWAGCPAHHVEDGRFPWTFYGWYERKAAPGRIRRFFCQVCERTFSTQTFSTTYYMKRPELLVPVAARLNNSSGDRSIRRTVPPNPDYAPQHNAGAAGSTITRLVPRLARHAMLFLVEAEHLAAARGAAPEPRAVDDFEAFAVTQLHQVSCATVVGRTTSWVYYVDQAPHRRGGRLTPAQKAAERRLLGAGTIPRKARARAWSRVVDQMLAQLAPGTTVDCVSDGDRTIAEALAAAGGRIRHTAHPNPKRGPKGSPSTVEALTRDRAMREIDLLHRWYRHSIAQHRRESISFPRSVNGLLGRLVHFSVARNLVQARRERQVNGPTPAQLRGLTERPLDWTEILELRRFPRRLPKMPPGWRECYTESIPTLGSKPSRRRYPRHARLY